MHGGVGDSAQMDQGVTHLPRFCFTLRRVGQLLEAAPAADRDVRARRRNTQSGGRLQPVEFCLCVPSFDACNPCVQTVSRKPAIDEHDASGVARETCATEREVLYPNV